MMYEDRIASERRDRDRFLAEHYASPLPDEVQEGFTGLTYFPIDPAWRLAAEFVAHEATVEVPSSAGTASPYTRLGTATMRIDGMPVVLTVLDDGDGNPFIAFGDATCGTDTYGGGRYVDLEPDGDGWVVDFNRARNPYCAYDPEFVCPLPPAANRLPVPVTAGERAFEPPGS